MRNPFEQSRLNAAIITGLVVAPLALAGLELWAAVVTVLGGGYYLLLHGLQLAHEARPPQWPRKTHQRDP